MSFPTLPPIPVEPDAAVVAGEGKDCDFVDRRELCRVLLGSMPTAGESDGMVHGEPPLGEYAGLRDVVAVEPAPIEESLEFLAPAPVDEIIEPVGLVELVESVESVEPEVALRFEVPAVNVEPARVERRLADELTGARTGEEASDAEKFRRPPPPRPAASGSRRVSPPLCRRSASDPEEAFGRRKPHFAGIWVVLSSAAASMVLLLLTSVGLSHYGQPTVKPGLATPASEPGESGGGAAPSPRPPGLVASDREEF